MSKIEAVRYLQELSDAVDQLEEWIEEIDDKNCAKETSRPEGERESGENLFEERSICDTH